MCNVSVISDETRRPAISSEQLPSNSYIYRAGLFLPRCMERRRGLAMRILSVSLSVRPSV